MAAAADAGADGAAAGSAERPSIYTWEYFEDNYGKAGMKL